MPVRSLGLFQVVVVLVVGLESQQVVSLLGVLPLVSNTGMGGVVALTWRGGTIHGSPFVVSVLLQTEKGGFLGVVTEVVFVVVVLVGKMVWCVLLTQNVHLAPKTQQAEQAGFTRAKNHETCQSIFPEN
jgi:hypothetical protein